MLPSAEMEETSRELIVALTSCRQSAEKIGCRFAADLIGAALLEVALQSIGGKDTLSNPGSRLEKLIELKFLAALSGNAGNVFPIKPPTR
ncbi:hypothetical protein [Rhizobium sp. L1K21]|uniref:hypothetical protein n=1 Tax=Rhizobium sp. L1K21 TaxID=2954933 RepID=UPI002093DF91|nr:hypothetical protein [Rhizobium sp. L1K21]MCO6187450.1 hypothetical protein [Rhizobium sp. L1K21]